MDVCTWQRAVAALLAASMLAGCALPWSQTPEVRDVPQDETSTDMMYDTRVNDAALVVFPYEDLVVTVEHPQIVSLPWYEPLEEGKFYRIVADVTYLNGGVAGYVDYPEIESVTSCEEVSPSELELRSVEETPYGLTRIGDYADGDLFFYETGIKAVWKDGSWVYAYDDTLTLDDGRLVCIRSGLAEEEVVSGIEEGTLCCADYFVLPPVA